MRVNDDGSITLRRGLPFQEKTVRVTVKWPPSFLTTPPPKSYVKRGNFMEILVEAQQKHKGATISVSVVKEI